MADRDEPNKHVEDQDVKLPRKQPLSPQHQGIDPLTESDTMYPAHDTRRESEKLAKRELDDEPIQAQELGNNTETGEENSQPADVVSESRENLAEADKASDEEPANADGRLPKDAQVANHKRNDSQNTSPSNKPATTDEPHDGSGSTDNEPKETRGRSNPTKTPKR